MRILLIRRNLIKFILLVLALLESSIALESGNLNDEFIISYRAKVKDNVLLGEEYNVSKVLRRSVSYRIIDECEMINTAELDSKSAMLVFLRESKDEILDCLNRHIHSNVREDLKSIDNMISSQVLFKITPRRIIVESKDSKILIKVIEEIKK